MMSKCGNCGQSNETHSPGCIFGIELEWEMPTQPLGEPEPKTFDSCLDCGVELAPALDAYFGTERYMDKYCIKCRRAMGCKG
jgi:hypothetical protein